MRSKKAGTSTSEVLNISNFGIWILVLDKEYFLPYKDYPWFKEAKVSDILDIKLRKNKYLSWESLDIELEIESLSKLEQYPLVYQE